MDSGANIINMTINTYVFLTDSYYAAHPGVDCCAVKEVDCADCAGSSDKANHKPLSHLQPGPAPGIFADALRDGSITSRCLDFAGAIWMLLHVIAGYYQCCSGPANEIQHCAMWIDMQLVVCYLLQYVHGGVCVQRGLPKLIGTMAV